MAEGIERRTIRVTWGPSKDSTKSFRRQRVSARIRGHKRPVLRPMTKPIAALASAPGGLPRRGDRLRYWSGHHVS